jgi:hypothetical protein
VPIFSESEDYVLERASVNIGKSMSNSKFWLLGALGKQPDLPQQQDGCELDLRQDFHRKMVIMEKADGEKSIQSSLDKGKCLFYVPLPFFVFWVWRQRKSLEDSRGLCLNSKPVFYPGSEPPLSQLVSDSDSELDSTERLALGSTDTLSNGQKADLEAAQRLAKRLYRLDGFRKADVARHLGKK